MRCYVAKRAFQIGGGRGPKLKIDIGEAVWLDDNLRLYCRGHDFLCPQIVGAVKAGWLVRMSPEREASMDRPGPRGDVKDAYAALLVEGNPY